MNLKVESARRQLGTALALYLMDHDPVSVHCLAGGGCEVIEFYAGKSAAPFVTQVLNENPNIDLERFRRLQRQYWTAFKHATRWVGKGKAVERDDDELLYQFTDEQNDVALFIGWSDYAKATGTMPIEAQVQQAWWIAKNLEKLHPNHSKARYEGLFPNIKSLPRADQKRLLREKIEWARSVPEVMSDPKTERRALILPWDHGRGE
ncbi:hypothetical protein GGR34_003496 [Microvirga flocculans]|uniref:Uncharacterized protein n=1 Tax=Microvirga flocculans TaxID=217168 RepID=A0A7W6IJ36_9HYPH|nr:hypothetical protein [Microvirga flocculans]MBB4041815.1 hypothetical protein [Microvirga flocculans]